MRPQQQNRRMRGRGNNGGNNNRKGPNPLNRNYESNGPDVKIRGSAQQIAEKYATLARDAMSSGDRVMAENYLQHAEHYNRIIAAAQAQMPIQHVQHRGDDFDDDLDEDFENGTSVAEAQMPAASHGSGPQPVIEGMPAEVALNADGAREANGTGRHRDRRSQNGRRSEFGQGGQRDEQQQARREGGGRGDGAQTAAEPAPEPAIAEAAPVPEPEIVPAEAAVPGPEADAKPVASVAAEESTEKAAEEAAPRRARRPRRPRATAEKDAETAVAAAAGEEAGVAAEG